MEVNKDDLNKVINYQKENQFNPDLYNIPLNVVDEYMSGDLIFSEIESMAIVRVFCKIPRSDIRLYSNVYKYVKPRMTEFQFIHGREFLKETYGVDIEPAIKYDEYYIIHIMDFSKELYYHPIVRSTGDAFKMARKQWLEIWYNHLCAY